MLLLKTPIGYKCIFHDDSRDCWSPILTWDLKEAQISCLMASLSLFNDEKAPIILPAIVCDYPEVFPQDLTGLLPERGMKFVIELVSGTTLISISYF